MAEELDGFYHQLEQKVQQRSKELIRSERLASVGYLAAGVAHEINNPLGIMAGHAEYSLDALKQQLGERAGPASEVEADLIKTLQTICDEAFRCKRITEKLLSFAGVEMSRDSRFVWRILPSKSCQLWEACATIVIAS